MKPIIPLPPMRQDPAKPLRNIKHHAIRPFVPVLMEHAPRNNRELHQGVRIIEAVQCQQLLVVAEAVGIGVAVGGGDGGAAFDLVEAGVDGGGDFGGVVGDGAVVSGVEGEADVPVVGGDDAFV